MYLNYVGTVGKIKSLFSFLKKECNAKLLLIILSYITASIVVLTLIQPALKLGKFLFDKLFRRKQVVSSSNRKYKKLNLISDSCSHCKSSSKCKSSSECKSSSGSSKSKCKPKENKVKKCKIKLSKKKIDKTLRQFKLD